MKKFSAGYISLSKASWVTPEIDNIRKRTLESLEKLPFEVVHGNALTTTTAEAGALCSDLTKKGVGAVVVHFATFPVGAIIPVIAREMNVPIVLFSTPEQPAKGGVWAQNSFCGANMAVHTLRKMGRKYGFVFGAVAEAGALLKEPLNVLNCMSTLASTKIGLVGGRVPGFYTSNCDELRLRSSIGVEVEIIDQLEIVDTANKLGKEETSRGIEAVRKSAASFCKSVEKDIEPAGKLYQALNKTALKYGLTSYAIRCWPEWSDIFGIAPCAAIGMLNDMGLVSSCEGDILGAVLMKAQASLSGGIPFFADLISFDYVKNTAVLWHCGAAPSALCRKSGDSKMRQHFRVDGGDKKGLVNEFPLKPGPVTLAQLDEDGNGYRMLIAKGTALDTDQIIRGNPLNVKFDCPVEKLVNTIMNDGYKHHYSLIHADIEKELVELCRWLNINPVCIQ